MRTTFHAPWIEMTVGVPCSNRCSYCPQDKLIANYHGTNRLTLETFKKVLENIPTDVIIVFSGFCEPFLNRETSDMMYYANWKGYALAVWSTLAGITDEDAEKIKDIPFINFNIHENPELKHEKKDYKFITERHKAIPNSRGGNLYPEEREEVVHGCARGNKFNHNIMMPNGDVYLCCSDWSLQHKLGNLLETNFNDLKREKSYELCHYCAYAV